jgi:hypothetical protein
LAFVSLAAIAVIVVAATAAEAIRQDSWGPVWMNAWVPAVLLASFSPAAGRSCRPRLRGRTRS